MFGILYVSVCVGDLLYSCHKHILLARHRQTQDKLIVLCVRWESLLTYTHCGQKGMSVKGVRNWLISIGFSILAAKILDIFGFDAGSECPLTYSKVLVAISSRNLLFRNFWMEYFRLALTFFQNLEKRPDSQPKNCPINTGGNCDFAITTPPERKISQEDEKIWRGKKIRLSEMH